MSKVLTAAEILAAQDRKRELVEVPEWGGSVYVQEISAADAERISEAQSIVGFCSLCIVDENGERLFSEEDAEALGKKGTAAMRRVMDAVTRINGVSEEDEGKN